jgi:outer membrane lipoprotein SlyB
MQANDVVQLPARHHRPCTLVHCQTVGDTDVAGVIGLVAGSVVGEAVPTHLAKAMSRCRPLSKDHR